MTKSEKNRIAVENFCNVYFKNCKIHTVEKQHKVPPDFYLNVKKYFLGETEIIYQHERPDEFKIIFDRQFLKKLSWYVPVKGKKQYFRDWLYKTHLPNFEYKNIIKF